METVAIQDSATGQRLRLGWPLLLAVIWLGATVAGLCLLANYAGTPGQDGNLPKHWPTDTALTLNPHGDTLVMFVHPHCPCSRASLAELERLAAHCEHPITSWIVFYKPAEMSDEWEHSDLWRSAEAMPSAHVISDVNSVEAGRFHAFVSGQTGLYDAQGQLLFSGGITGARGHEGENAGESAIEDFVNHGDAGCRQCPVFGCPIVYPSSTH